MSLDQDVAILRTIPPFDLFEQDALRLIAFSAEIHNVRAGEVLFRKGESSDGGYLVTGGSFTLDLGEGSGETSIVGPGALMGALAMFAAIARPATVTAREPATVLKLPAALLRRVLENYPASAHRLRERIGADVRGTEASLADIEHLLEPMAQLLKAQGAAKGRV